MRCCSGKGMGAGTDDCNDDSNQFINNIMYGNYYYQWYTKGNIDGNRGHHTFQHNLMYVDDFSRAGMGFIYGGPPYCPSGQTKIANIFRDNLLYSNGAQDGGVDYRVLFTLHDAQSTVLAQADHNMFWAPSGTWNYGYNYSSTDIHGPQPIFTNAAAGDFSFVAGSPGKGAASDGKDIGIEYNSYLKKQWLQNAFSLPTQQKSGTTNSSFTVDPNHYYQVWFYIPVNSAGGTETFNVEGSTLSRDISELTTGSTWTQPGGPMRWITLGPHRATDGTLNISWTNPGSSSKIFIRQIPTTDEAYQWIVKPSTLAPPADSRVLQVQ